MRIIHCADLHLESKLDSNLSTEKAKIRKNELLFSFENIAQYASKNNVTAIIIAGDMFDSDKVSSSTKRRVLSNITLNPKIKFFYLSGNHDEDSFINGLEDIPQNLIVFNNEWKYVVLDNVVICGASINGKNQENLYNSLVLSENTVNIAVMHGQVSIYDNDNDENINVNKLKNKNIDYLALGHYHSFQQGKIDERGTYAYSGTLEGRGFDECGEKGFVLLDIEGDKISSKFVSFSKRQLSSVEIDISVFDSWQEIEREILSRVNNIDGKNLVKIVLTGKFNINLNKDVTYLAEKLNNQFFFAKIKDESVLKVQKEDFINDKSLKGEFIRTVLESDCSEEDKNQIILMGIKALDGESL